jgi:hypothetical protein
MTQKEILTHALSFVEQPYSGYAALMKAARASFVIAWLHDMNWHPEADAIQAKLDSMVGAKEAVMEADLHSARANERDSIASFLNWIYGWGLERDGWRETKGAVLVEELWALITTLS